MSYAPARRCLSVLLAAAAIPLAAGTATAQVSLEPYITSGLSSPIFLTAPNNDNRTFIVERGGRVRVVINNVLQTTPMVDISSRVRTDGEMGLLGMAFPPDFATTRTFFLNYSNSSGANVIERFTLPVGSNTAASSTGTVMLTVPSNGNTNHKAGWIGFRPGENSNLYIATGDSGGGNDTANLAQTTTDLRGKMLRINITGSTAAAPSNNPFVSTTPGTGTTTTADDFVWAFGLRNSFRNSFDRVTGNLFIADVGQSAREEVNGELANSPGGRNYGWRVREGSIQNPAYSTAPVPANAVNPIFDYARGASLFSPAGNAASITGGYVYRGPTASPQLAGQYIFGDYVTGRLGALTLNPTTLAVTGVTDLTSQLDPGGTRIGRFNLVSFGEDSVGNLFVIDDSGEVYRIVPEPAAASLLLPAAALLLNRRRR